MRLLTWPHSFLTINARALSPTEIKLKAVERKIRQMLDIMYEHGGIGLAATQVGWDARVLVMDPDNNGKPMALINPIITQASEEKVKATEGCLSFPGISEEVWRAKEVSFDAFLPGGIRISGKAKDLGARVLQHELEHLQGIVFTKV